MSQWTPEAQVWYDRFQNLPSLGTLTSHALFTPGLSMIYPLVHCTSATDGAVCHATVGEGEINAAATMMALVLSPRFDLTKTYFLFSGIAGVNPRYATLGGVALARYTVQVALQYEIDARSLPVYGREGEEREEEGADWPSGYFAYGTDSPLQYPTITYGTEVFELNANLRNAAYELASKATLADAEAPRAYREHYRHTSREEDDDDNPFAAAVAPPRVVQCDTATSDVYYSGTVLAETFENTTAIWTNGTGVYCMTAQEDNANLEVMLRAAVEGLVDFSRIIVMRTGSNFDRPPPGVSDWEHLALSDQNGFDIAIDNIFNAGIAIVSGIVEDWDCGFSEGVEAENYIGDIFGSLGGEPDFGLGSITGGEPVAPGGGEYGHDERMLEKREMKRRIGRRGRLMKI